MEEAINRNSATVCQYGKELEIIKAAADHGTHADADANSFSEGADGLDDPSAEDVPTAAAPEKDEKEDAVSFAERADDEGPFTAAQNIVLDRNINTTIMKILDPFIDMFCGEVRTMIADNV